MKRIFAILISAATISCSTVQPASASEEIAVIAGGCFWGVEAVFEHVNGVKDVRSGYAGGIKETATYKAVSEGRTNHAEAVEVRFDPSKVSYDQLLEIFFSVIHDPTQLNRQGPDEGPQYRSAIFYRSDAQKASADVMIKKLTEAKTFSKPIVTEIAPLATFYPADDYHQDYMRKNPKDPYIVYHDVPKVKALKEKFGALYKD